MEAEQMTTFFPRVGGPCRCDVPKLAGGCDQPGHQHLMGECRNCHRPRLDWKA
jgi:hypothetical protein